VIDCQEVGKGENVESLFTDYGVSVWEDEKSWWREWWLVYDNVNVLMAYFAVYFTTIVSKFTYYTNWKISVKQKQTGLGVYLNCKVLAYHVWWSKQKKKKILCPHLLQQITFKKA
jgi:hypothetical protein